jgi:hypothetical protein
MKPKAKTKVAFARIEDKSLQAYKDMINDIAAALNMLEGNDDEMTEDEWIADWKKYWGDEWEGDAEHPKG